MKEFYIKRENNTFGPLNSKELRKAATEGRVTVDDKVGTTKKGPWYPAHKIEKLFPTQEAFDIQENEAEENHYASDEANLGEDIYDFAEESVEASNSTEHESDWNHVDDAGSIRRDLVEELVPTIGMPREIKELIPQDERIYFADHPAKMVLYLRWGVLFFFWLIAQVLTVMNGINGISIAPLFVTAIIAYAIYASWVTTYYVITSKLVIYRGGWFNRKIKFASLPNIQEISVNTGLIDRWLNLNTVLFSTAASSALLIFGMTGIRYGSVDSRIVLRAFQNASK
ncbi:PH domain-containing protein [Planctomycetaceae bacterium]|nr:PH domain-containing protein [Planctomycetaceae bacterium]